VLTPNDLPLMCLPTGLSDEAVAELVEFLQALTESIERYYCAELRRYYDRAEFAQQRDLDFDPPPNSDPPF
jgi:hypothetical protein